MSLPTIPRRGPDRRHSRAAFTLVELLLVVVILGVLAAVAVIALRDPSEDAHVAAMASVVRTVQKQIDLHHAKHAAYPPTVDPSWFQGELANTWNSTHATPVWISPDPAKLYPSNKDFTDASASTLWYTPFFGRFYARVPRQGTNAETLALFNRVNGTRLTDLNQTQ